MTITICASKSFDREAAEKARALRQLGHTVHIPLHLELWPEHGQGDEETLEFSREYDIMQRHFARLKSTDAVLALNYAQEGVAGYIGGGVLMEIGFAHVLHKHIYLLNPIPDVPYRDEIELLKPIVIDGDLSKIPMETSPTPSRIEFGTGSSQGDHRASPPDLLQRGSDQVREGNMKRVKTFDARGKENGFLMELQKEGRHTTCYLTCVSPGSFKGYHLHRVRETNYTAVRGVMKVIVYVRAGGAWKRSEHALESTAGATLHIPANAATGFMSATNEEAWMINFPRPPYDPELQDEQVEYTQDELENGVVK